MIPQEMMTMMTSRELIKVVLTFCLFLFICVVGMVDNSPTIRKLHDDGVRIPYPLYDANTNYASLHPTRIYNRKIANWFQDFADLIIISVLPWFLILRPDMKRWGFDLSYMWVLFFYLMIVDRLLFHGRLPYGFIMEVFLLSVQAIYTFDCALIWKTDNNRYNPPS